MSTKDNDPAQDPNKAAPATGDRAIAADGADVAPEAAATPAPAPELEAPVGAEATADAAPADVQVTAAVADAAAAHANTHDGAADEVAAEPVAEPDIPGQLPGELLAARRLEMRLSIEELASRVKLAPRQLIALEANDFGSLPGMATTRGFIRSCAKAMGMDPEPLLAMVAQEPNPALAPMVMRRPLPQPGFNGRRYAPSTSHRRSANKLSGLAAVVLIFVGMLAFVAWRNDWLHLPSLDLSAARDAVMPASTTNSAEHGQEPAPAAEATEASATDNLAASKAAAPRAAGPKATAAKTTAASDAEVYAPTAPAPVAPAAAGAARAEPAKAAPAAANVDPARALELKLREDAWVEVLTQNGERKLVSRLMKAGSTERIEVTEPLILVVGNAAGVDVTLRGQPVNLKSGTRDNVAKLNLK